MYFAPSFLNYKAYLNKNQRRQQNEKSKKQTTYEPIPHDIINETTPLWKKDPSKLKNLPLLKYYTVFNAEQIEGIKFPNVKDNKKKLL